MLGRTAIDLKFEICAIDKLLVSANELACKGANSFLGPRYGILFLPNGDKVKMEVHNSVYWIRIRLPTSSKVGDDFDEEKMIAMAVEEHKRETLLAATNKKPCVQAAAVGKKVNFDGQSGPVEFDKNGDPTGAFIGIYRFNSKGTYSDNLIKVVAGNTVK